MTWTGPAAAAAIVAVADTEEDADVQIIMLATRLAAGRLSRQ